MTYCHGDVIASVLKARTAPQQSYILRWINHLASQQYAAAASVTPMREIA